jgi:hypothetical protein
MNQETFEIVDGADESVTTTQPSTEQALACTTPDLNKESLELIGQIIAETDEQRAKDLTYLFNVNQNKKTMVRVNKLSDLLDTITDQALARFTARPDEISNKELFDGLKTVQDLIERGQKQVAGPVEAPLIQVNNQTNEVKFGASGSTLNRDSRERVKTAVLGLLDSIVASQANQPTSDDIVEVPAEEDGVE